MEQTVFCSRLYFFIWIKLCIWRLSGQQERQFLALLPWLHFSALAEGGLYDKQDLLVVPNLIRLDKYMHTNSVQTMQAIKCTQSYEKESFHSTLRFADNRSWISYLWSRYNILVEFWTLTEFDQICCCVWDHCQTHDLTFDSRIR